MSDPNLKELYKKYGLQPEDMFPHQHYTIITRQGIEKIEAKANITVEYEHLTVTPTYCAMKCTASIEGKDPVVMYASALNDPRLKLKNCTNTYLLEMAQKRSLSRSVLKLCGFYTLGHYGEDESDAFTKATPTQTQIDGLEIKRINEELKTDTCTLERAQEIYDHYNALYLLSDGSGMKWGAIIDVALQQFGADINDKGVDNEEL